MTEILRTEISDFYEGAKRLRWNLDFMSKIKGGYNTSTHSTDGSMALTISYIFRFPGQGLVRWLRFVGWLKLYVGFSGGRLSGGCAYACVCVCVWVHICVGGLCLGCVWLVWWYIWFCGCVGHGVCRGWWQLGGFGVAYGSCSWDLLLISGAKAPSWIPNLSSQILCLLTTCTCHVYY